MVCAKVVKIYLLGYYQGRWGLVVETVYQPTVLVHLPTLFTVLLSLRWQHLVSFFFMSIATSLVLASIVIACVR